MLVSLYTTPVQAIGGILHFPLFATPGNDSTYFAMDNVTGELTTAKEIDREVLLTEGVQSFTLDVVATEYENGTVAQPEDSGSSTQVCLLLIYFVY